jgi:hypothetical protein
MHRQRLLIHLKRVHWGAHTCAYAQTDTHDITVDVNYWGSGRRLVVIMGRDTHPFIIIIVVVTEEVDTHCKPI